MDFSYEIGVPCGTPIDWITRVYVAPASQRDVAALAQDGGAVPVVTHAAVRAAAAGHGARPLAQRVVPADARPDAAQVVHAVRFAASAHAPPALRRAAPGPDG